MPQRNGQRSRNGRSAMARRVLFSGPGSADGLYANTNNGGGMKKVDIKLIIKNQQ